MKKIILAGGGTAGHITPNIALLPYLRSFDIHYVGEENGMEHTMLKDYPFVTFHAVPCVKLVRSLTPKNLTIPFKLLQGISAAKKLIKELRPAVIFSKGGFAALPIMLAANKDTPLLLHESDFSMGLANKLAAKKCTKILTTFSEVSFKYDKGVHTGTPLRQELYCGSKDSAAKAAHFSQNSKPNVLIMGGSQGATAINNAVRKCFNELVARYNIVHIVGKGNLSAQHFSPFYYQTEFTHSIADFLSWADIAVTRGGANAITELMALKKPSLIIPLPKGNSRGDQEDNARYFADKGCALVLSQEDLTASTLLARVSELITKKKNITNSIEQLPSVDGTRKIAALLNAYR